MRLLRGSVITMTGLVAGAGLYKIIFDNGGLITAVLLGLFVASGLILERELTK